MHIEHIAWQVDDPAAVADWYCEHLGFTVKRSADEPVPVRFIADGSGRVMLEVYHNPAAAVLDYANMHPLQLHLAFTCDDIDGTAERLVAAGCTRVETIGDGSPGADHIVMLRDPFGFAIQFCRRAEPMVPPPHAAE